MLIDRRFDGADLTDHEGGCLAELDRAVEKLWLIDPPATSGCVTGIPVADGLDRGRRLRSLAFRLAVKHTIKRLRRFLSPDTQIRQALHRGPHMVYPSPQDVASSFKSSKS